MKLYHGTSERHLAAILKYGLQPRGKRKGNWKHTVDSNPDAIYLTEAYALYFAYQAVDPGNKAERLVVLEIDTDKLNLFLLAPDEDWLEQISRQMNEPHLAPINKPMAYRTRWYRKRLLTFSGHWQDSLKGLGNCTYHDMIPVHAITRIAFVDQQTNAGMVMSGIMDPFISLPNYRYVGARYRAATQRLFGETAEEVDDFARLRTPEQNAAYKAFTTDLYAKVEVRQLS